VTDSVLTPLQNEVLEGLFAARIEDHGYFLTGGTALAEFYFKHRYSVDLDLFTRKGRLDPADFELVRRVFEVLKLEIEEDRCDENFARYHVRREGLHEPLKVEVCNDVAAKMAPPIRRGNVVVDSLEDIAVNKVCAILDRGPEEPKHLCDLYFLLREGRFNMDYLIGRAGEKQADFDGEEGQLAFAVQVRRVVEIEMMPKMIRPLTKCDLESYLVPLAETLIRRFKPQGPPP